MLLSFFVSPCVYIALLHYLQFESSVESQHKPLLALYGVFEARCDAMRRVTGRLTRIEPQILETKNL